MSPDQIRSVQLRFAQIADVPLILQFVRELAEYEREPGAVVASEADFIRDGFGAYPKFRVLIAELNQQPAGFAFFFYHYSTWLGRAGIFLEDLFVRPEFRGQGIGKALLRRVAQIALQENCYGVRWEVLDWNTSAIKFYESLDVKSRKEWLSMKITGEALQRLASGAASSHASEDSSSRIV